jgi:DNA-binding response OmpR family regulator
MITKKFRVLLCEDDESLGSLLKEYLESKDFVVERVVNGVLGFTAFQNTKYDICILDVMLPKKDGFTLAKDIRKVNANVPIIFLTAKNTKEDVLEGFKSGADDYVTKPFNMQELLMRIEAIFRRINIKKHKEISHFQVGRYTFNAQKHTLTLDSKITKLTTKENDLLTLLCLHMNEILDREFTVNLIWKPQSDFYQFAARSMDVYITKLRKLLKDDPRVEIMNIHGQGYKLIVPTGR